MLIIILPQSARLIRLLSLIKIEETWLIMLDLLGIFSVITDLDRQLTVWSVFVRSVCRPGVNNPSQCDNVMLLENLNELRRLPYILLLPKDGFNEACVMKSCGEIQEKKNGRQSERIYFK